MLSIIVAFLTILTDQITKALVASNLECAESIPVIKNILNITFVKNEGMAFGFFSDNRIVFMIPTVVLIAFVCYIIIKLHGKNRFFDVAAGLILGGGVGNMIDRVLRGYVVDFVDFCAFDFWKWVFNVADAAVFVGCVAFAVVILKNGSFFDDIKKTSGDKDE